MRGGERSVTAPWPAEIIEWLVEDGDPVSAGSAAGPAAAGGSA
jgi:biotin carboxyl carrier protein